MNIFDDIKMRGMNVKMVTKLQDP